MRYTSLVQWSLSCTVFGSGLRKFENLHLHRYTSSFSSWSVVLLARSRRPTKANHAVRAFGPAKRPRIIWHQTPPAVIGSLATGPAYLSYPSLPALRTGRRALVIRFSYQRRHRQFAWWPRTGYYRSRPATPTRPGSIIKSRYKRIMLDGKWTTNRPGQDYFKVASNRERGEESL